MLFLNVLLAFALTISVLRKCSGFDKEIKSDPNAVGDRQYRVMNKHVATQAGWNSVGFQYGLGSRGISSRSKAQWK